MRKQYIAMAASTLVMGAAQAGVIPSGLQANVSNATIAGWGWTECSRTNAYVAASTAAVLNSCQGDYLAMGIWDASLGAYGVVGVGAYHRHPHHLRHLPG